MLVNVDNVKKLVSQAYFLHVRDAFGQAGMDALTDMLDHVKLIFKRCPPECLSTSLTVIKNIGDHSPSLVFPPEHITTYNYSFDTLWRKILEVGKTHHPVVEIKQNGEYRFFTMETEPDLTSLAVERIIYKYESETDHIYAKQYRNTVPKISSLLKSNFADPSLSNLEEALERYYYDLAAHSRCKILANIWEGKGGVDGPCLVLKNKPEELMRDSLVQALVLLTRDTSVRPEHKTDERKPVDIKVEWFGVGAAALIEIKWLGKSLAVSRKKKPDEESKTYTEYDASRAISGAKQLADYLDREIRHTNSSSTKGYLVVFDARRRKTGHADEALLKEDALYYKEKDVFYSPDYSTSRDDFAKPIRFFLEPRASHFLQTE